MAPALRSDAPAATDSESHCEKAFAFVDVVAAVDFGHNANAFKPIFVSGLNDLLASNADSFSSRQNTLSARLAPDGQTA